MGRSTTVILYITVALFILILISFSPSSPPHRHHRRLKLRSSFDVKQHSPITFDPLVAEIERRREDKEWERHYFEENHKEFTSENSAPGAEAQPEWEDFIDAEDYLNDDRFNITQRLVSLFPQIDLDPVDGFVSVDELTEWNMKSAQKEVMHRTARDMELHDKNHDGFVSFQEYEAPSWARTLSSSDDNSSIHNIGWWSGEHFNASDGDGDGLLNQTEFNDFLHPIDSNNPRLLRWLCKEEIRERDTDKDGKLNFKEFFHGLFDSIRDYDEEGHNSSHNSNDSTESPAKKLFAELDKDNDGYLSEEEMLPVVDKLHPPERYYAKQQADYVISQADTDKDGRLSLHEMIDNPYVFYSAIFNEEDDYYHEEFR